MSLSGILHQRGLTRTRDSPQNPDSQLNPLAQRLGRGSGLRLDLDVLGHIIENADADVIEAEVFLDFADNLGQHLLGIFAGDRGLGNVVQKGELPGATLLFRKEAGIFHRHRNLAGGGLHDIQVALLEQELSLRVESGHHAGGLSTQQNGSAAETFGRFPGNKTQSQAVAHLLQVRADQ